MTIYQRILAIPSGTSAPTRVGVGDTSEVGAGIVSSVDDLTLKAVLASDDVIVGGGASTFATIKLGGIGISAAGTLLSPALTFDNDTDTGFYSPAGNSVGVVAFGAETARFNANGVFVSLSGIAGVPSLSWTSDNDTGFFLAGANAIGFSSGGAEGMRLDSSGLGIGVTADTRLHVDTNAAVTTAILKLENTTTSMRYFVSNATPEGAITGNVGDECTDTTTGTLYKKTSGVGNTGWTALATGSGVTTMGAIGSSPNANGATITGNTLVLQPASASFGGVLTTGTQTIAGAKTFSGQLSAGTGAGSAAAPQLIFGDAGADSGFYQITDNAIGMSLGGSLFAAFRVSGASTDRMALTGGVLAASSRLLYATATLQDTSANNVAMTLEASVNNSSTFGQTAMFVDLSGDVTPSSSTITLNARNNTKSTSTADPMADNSTIVNSAGFLNAVSSFASTTGTRVGAYCRTAGEGRAFGAFGTAVPAGSGAGGTARVVGVAGSASLQNGTIASPTQTALTATAGYFVLRAFSGTSFSPTYVSAALAASNGDTTSPVLTLQDGTTTVLTVLDGGQTQINATNSAATPALSIGPSAGTSDANTGLFSAGADILGITTNGVERVRWSSTAATGVVFNNGNADYDFRVNGDTVSDLLVVDASVDTVLIHGYRAGRAGATTSNTNTAVGLDALAGSSGTNNTAFGSGVLSATSAFTNNTAFGFNALNQATGNENSAFGSEALLDVAAGIRNCAFGRSALAANTADGNTAMGYRALVANTTGTQNVAVGFNAGRSIVDGQDNVAVGHAALDQCVSGDNNVAMGTSALGSATAGGNVGIGPSAGGGITSGTNNTAVGYLSLTTGTFTGSNVTCIGYDAEPSTSSVSNEITLGDANVTTLRCATTTITAISDARDKTEIVDLDLGLDFVERLKPRRFRWNKRDLKHGGPARLGPEEAGFIAQELDQAATAAKADWVGLVSKNNPERLEVSQGKLLPILVKALQELSARVRELEFQAALA